MSDTIFGTIKKSEFIAGLAGGAVSTLVLHPLDLAKIRLQVNECTGVVYRPNSKGTFRTLIEICQIRGPRGLYLGFAPNLIASSGSWGLYFMLYAALKKHSQGGDASKTLGTANYLACSALAGSLTLSVMNPFWVLKTRLCLQYEHLVRSIDLSPGAREHVGSLRNPPSTTWNALCQLWRGEGVRGLYRGYLVGLVGVSHGAIQFTLYEKFRNLYNIRYRGRASNAKMSALEYLACASLSKLIASSLTYPYQVIRSRLQDHNRIYSGVSHVITELWRYEGPRGFYKGLFPNLLRVTPACAITFLVYEYTIEVFRVYFH